MNMKHLKQYEESAINEAEVKLGAMPAFLKAAGAKPGGSEFGSPMGKNIPDDHWNLEVKSPFKKDNIIMIMFYPNKSFTFSTAIGSGGKYGGKWQEGSSSDVFQLGETKIKGVKMQFTLFGGMQTVNFVN